MKIFIANSAKLSHTYNRFLGAILMVALMAVSSAMSIPILDLRSTSNFAILAGSTVTGIPPVSINGNVGLSPAAGSFITGFDATNVAGIIYVVDASGPAGSVIAASLLTTAKGDITIAYNDAAGRTPVPSGPFLNPGAGNIGGLNLVAGLYKFTGAAAIVGTDVTLTGNSTDVWIFQIGSSLNVGSGIRIILAGGAQASNIFWQVGTSATIGTYAVFKGTILADQSVSFGTGATIDGRALAFTAAVTMGSGVVVKLPAPAPSLNLSLTSPMGAENWLIGSSHYITWTSNGISNVKLEISSNGGITYSTLVASTPASAGSYSWNIPSNQIAGTSYKIRISDASNSNTNSVSGNFSIVTAQSLLAKPVLFSPVIDAINQPLNLKLKWLSVINATAYNVQLAKDAQFTNIIAEAPSLAALKFAVNNLSNSTLYFWRVRAFNALGTSLWSDVRSFTTTQPTPAAPLLKYPANGATNQLTAFSTTWNTSLYASYYQLQVSNNINFSSLIVNKSNISVNGYSVSGLAANVKYYWRVKAFNNNGSSAWSQVWNFSTVSGFTLTLENKETCQGSPIQLGTFDIQGHLITVLGGSGSYKYTWSPSSGLTNATTGSPTVTNPQYSYSLGLTVKDLVTMKTVSGTMTLHVNKSPSVCIPNFMRNKLGTSFDLNSKITSITGGTAPYTTSWKDPQGSILINTLVNPPIGLSRFSVTAKDASGCSSPAQVISVFSSLQKAGNSDDDVILGLNGSGILYTYPNPAMSTLNVNAEFSVESAIEISISNLMGQEVYIKTLRNSKIVEESLDVSSLTSGMYIITLRTAEETIIKRFIKQ